MSKSLTPRQRVEAMLAFRPVEIPVVDCAVNAVGLYEHGEKLRELLATLDSEFGPVSRADFPRPAPADYNDRGEYHRFHTDEWGIEWESRIFGIAGHPLRRPLDDWAALDSYAFPTSDHWDDERKAREYAAVRAVQDGGYFTRRGWIKYLEQTYAVRKFEDVLMDVALRDEELLRFTARLHEYNRRKVQNWLDAGADAIQFADDLGTQSSLLISPDCFRDIYKPLFAELVAMVKAAGKYAFYHTCGYSLPLLADLKEIGIDAVWPQPNAYDLRELAAHCRALGLAVAVHPERSGLMTHGSPDEVRRRMYEYNDIFRPQDGGAYFYFEIDNGFPYENIVAMVEVMRELRGG